jgi:hypothetical protein
LKALKAQGNALEIKLGDKGPGAKHAGSNNGAIMLRKAAKI